ncbi:TetR/AcrR family transcriptional regulator [Amycolatopsis sp. OK19-0408]|uniref:TetR/AcrR family transcriptional regulator n=1 Tax=Amycolatopsis iheyensis TaxID=2945988 RepID=A0A9X2SI54_9PSEU|nr:TetR/AcrR family transcriptional regulator [Amycolatopsis iheyensis]MCR6483412.1 TetR/AcrR family transcriptional regulator [Amycolatopsis iheyensis]
MPTPDARERILGTASRLFDRHGVHAVGLQRIIDECDCGKSLLYTHFAGKDDLVVAYLGRRVADWDRLVTGVRAATPEQRLVELVRAAGVRATEPGSRGCALRATLAEFPDRRHPAHRVAVAHLVRARAKLGELAAETSAHDPERLADRLMTIIDGLYANGPLFGDDAAKAAIAFAEDVVRAETSAEPAKGG